MLAKIQNGFEYDFAIAMMELLLTKWTKAGGFSHLTTEEAAVLEDLSKEIESHEDYHSQRMPVKYADDIDPEN